MNESLRAIKWEFAARELYRFVKEHISIVGWEEIDAWYEAKQAFDEANQTTYSNV